jgi:hypothetical protein
MNAIIGFELRGRTRFYESLLSFAEKSVNQKWQMFTVLAGRSRYHPSSTGAEPGRMFDGLNQQPAL